MNLAARLSRLEATFSPNSLHVVEGYTEAEHDERIAELVAAGKATPTDTFVCLLRFANRRPEVV